jgi:hypothetical protein
MKLSDNADLTYEDARDWYDSYGWHIPTKREGDVLLQAVKYDWLDDADDQVVIKKLRAKYKRLTYDEADALVACARMVRDTAEQVESLLEEAVEAYLRGDLDGVIEALDQAASLELDHGDSPASNSLRSQLIDDDDEDEDDDEEDDAEHTDE